MRSFTALTCWVLGLDFTVLAISGCGDGPVVAARATGGQGGATSNAGGQGGAAGEGTVLPCSDPQAVKVQAIAAGAEHTCALMTSGGVRCWGDNSRGQLGGGAAMYRSTPAPVLGICQ